MYRNKNRSRVCWNPFIFFVKNCHRSKLEPQESMERLIFVFESLRFGLQCMVSVVCVMIK